MAGQIEATAGTVQRPRLRRLLDYWQAKRGSRAMPARADIDPLDFPWLLGNISLTDVLPGAKGPRYRFRLIGTRAVQRFGYDPTGIWIDDLPEPAYRRHILAAYDELLRRRIPLVEQLDMMIDERMHDYEILRLPLSTDGVTIDMILLASDFFNPNV